MHIYPWFVPPDGRQSTSAFIEEHWAGARLERRRARGFAHQSAPHQQKRNHTRTAPERREAWNVQR